MSITVDQIYKQFPRFKDDDMKKLVGSSNFNGHTTISLDRIASYSGSMANELSIFTAQTEGEKFVNMLDGKKKMEVAQNAHIQPANNDSAMANNNQAIPKDTSIFTVAKQQKEQV